MKLSDLQSKYQDFYEYVIFAHSILSELTKSTDEYLLFYSKLNKHNGIVLYELEENLLFFQYFLSNLDNIIDVIDNAKFLQIKLSSTKKRKKKVIRYKYNNEYEHDLYVDLNYPLNINYIETTE